MGRSRSGRHQIQGIHPDIDATLFLTGHFGWLLGTPIIDSRHLLGLWSESNFVDGAQRYAMICSQIAHYRLSPPAAQLEIVIQLATSVGEAFHFNDVILHLSEGVRQGIQLLLVVLVQVGVIKPEINLLGRNQMIVVQIINGFRQILLHVASLVYALLCQSVGSICTLSSLRRSVIRLGGRLSGSGRLPVGLHRPLVSLSYVAVQVSNGGRIVRRLLLQVVCLVLHRGDLISYVLLGRAPRAGQRQNRSGPYDGGCGSSWSIHLV